MADAKAAKLRAAEERAAAALDAARAAAEEATAAQRAVTMPTIMPSRSTTAICASPLAVMSPMLSVVESGSMKER